MYNHVRTLLLNETHVVGESDHIPTTFSRIQLPPDIGYVYDLFIPSTATVDEKKAIVHVYLQLIVSSGFIDGMKMFDPRITYDVNPADFFETTDTFDFPLLYSKLKSASALIDNVLVGNKPRVDTTEFENVWKRHFSEVYQVSGLLIAFAARIDGLLK